jgi:hypothetical protein
MSDKNNNKKNKDRMSPPPLEPPAGLPPGPPRKPLPATGPPAEEEQEYEEEFEIEIRTQKGSSIKVETSSYDKLDDLLDKAFTTYQRLSKEEYGEVEEKQQYQ